MKEIFAEIKNIKSAKKDLKNFGLVVGIGLFIFGGILFFLKKPLGIYLLCISPVLIISGYLIPGILKPFQKVWMSFAVIMGWIMSNIILSIVFYLMMTPIGLLARIFGKDFLAKKIDTKAKSYWIDREQEIKDKETYIRQF